MRDDSQNSDPQPDPDPAAAARAQFADGAAGDVMLPGPGLSQLLADASTDLAAASDDELAGLIRGAGRQVACEQAGLAHAVQELSRRRIEQSGTERKLSYLAQAATDEIGELLVLSTAGADRLRSFASGLADLPPVDALLRAGQIDQGRAQVFLNELGWVDADTARDIAARYAVRATGWTAARLGRALARAVITADPEAAERRKAEARREARVTLGREHSGNASLSGRELPAGTAISLDNSLTSAAYQLAELGVPGSLAQLRVLVFTTLLDGRTVQSILDDPGSWPGAAGDGDDVPPPDSPSDAGGAGDPGPSPTPADPGGDPGDPGPAGPTDHPEEGAPDPDPAAADGGAAGSADPAPVPGGAAGAGRAARNTAVTARRPGSINVTVPLSALAGGSAPGEVTGFGLTDAPDTREVIAGLAADPRTAWHLTVTDAAGRPLGHACAPGGPAGGQSPAAWAAGLAGQVALLSDNAGAGGGCSHARASASYSPPESLRHLVQVRERVCGWGTCRQPAHRCDLDHAIPFDQGGLTCLCNLGPLCRRHHRCKQAPGWSLTRESSGVLRWVMPSGRTAVSLGEPYPV